eukprot:187638-Chlamydomonas_euryale.AAC.1
MSTSIPPHPASQNTSNMNWNDQVSANRCQVEQELTRGLEAGPRGAVGCENCRAHQRRMKKAARRRETFCVHTRDHPPAQEG